MAKTERPNVALRESKVNSVRRAMVVLRSRWDEGQASGRGGRLDVKRMLREERAAFKAANRRRD